MEHTLDIHERHVRVDLRTVATETFSIELSLASQPLVEKEAGLRDYIEQREATVRVYQDSWDGMQLSRFGEQLPCTREPGRGRIPSLWQW